MNDASLLGIAIKPARFYRLAQDRGRQLQARSQEWERTAAIIGRFFEVKVEDLS
jgi:PadR family transcriptional regulator, regulatory protein PadR